MAKINIFFDWLMGDNLATINRLAGGSAAIPLPEIPTGEDGTVYAFTITRLDVLVPRPDDIVLFPWNPDGYEIEAVPRWQSRGEAGAFEPSHHWSGNDPRMFRFEHLLEAPKNTDTLELIRLRLDEFARKPTEKTQRPTRVSVNAGVVQFIGVITAFNWRTLKTDSRGRATAAEFDLTIAEDVKDLYGNLG